MFVRIGRGWKAFMKRKVKETLQDGMMYLEKEADLELVNDRPNVG